SLAPVIDASAPRAIALPHLAPHGCSNGLALALARIGGTPSRCDWRWRWRGCWSAGTPSRCDWLWRWRGSDAGARGRFTSAQRRFFSSAANGRMACGGVVRPWKWLSSTCRCALDTRGHRNQKLDPVSDLRPYDAKSDSCFTLTHTGYAPAAQSSG